MKKENFNKMTLSLGALSHLLEKSEEPSLVLSHQKTSQEKIFTKYKLQGFLNEGKQKEEKGMNGPLVRSPGRRRKKAHHKTHLGETE